MNNTELLLQAMGGVRPEFVAEAACYKKRSRAGWAAAAACLLLAAALFSGHILLHHGSDLPASVSSSTIGSATAEVDYGFLMEGRLYLPITFDERKEFGLVPEDAVGLTPDLNRSPTEADVGELMGYAEESENPDLVGAAVYHWAKAADNDRICVVETAPGQYAYFVFAYRTDTGAPGDTSSEIFAAYGITPDSVKEIAVTTGDDRPVATLQDRADIETVLSAFSGLEDMGLQAYAQRCADLYAETYGAGEVYPNPGENTMYYDGLDRGDWTVYDRAHALWNEGQRQLLLRLANGDRLFLIYTPAVKSLSALECTFPLSDEILSSLNPLFGVE